MSDINPDYPHVAAEFFAWLLYISELEELELEHPQLGPYSVHLQDRITFRSPSEERMRAVVIGDDAPNSPETRAALASGKTIQEIKVHIAYAGNTIALTLRGAHMDISGLRIVEEVREPADESSEAEEQATMYLRMSMVDDIYSTVAHLFSVFARTRLQEQWHNHTVQQLRAWIHDIEQEAVV